MVLSVENNVVCLDEAGAVLGLTGENFYAVDGSYMQASASSPATYVQLQLDNLTGCVDDDVRHGSVYACTGALYELPPFAVASPVSYDVTLENPCLPQVVRVVPGRWCRCRARASRRSCRR